MSTVTLQKMIFLALGSLFIFSCQQAGDGQPDAAASLNSPLPQEGVVGGNEGPSNGRQVEIPDVALGGQDNQIEGDGDGVYQGIGPGEDEDVVEFKEVNCDDYSGECVCDLLEGANKDLCYEHHHEGKTIGQLEYTDSKEQKVNIIVLADDPELEAKAIFDSSGENATSDIASLQISSEGRSSHMFVIVENDGDTSIQEVKTLGDFGHIDLKNAIVSKFKIDSLPESLLTNKSKN